ncbi:unnamed protein product [Protopolystoma xenopodis]|uniref:Uncharacterized protein n=1 Tax=Protopolystoma xenopodis TaxID=117903 RepID=A0A3S5B1A4_9PLAT|nr:unnamed protein product [Protopolystoma xenopodis]
MLPTCAHRWVDHSPGQVVPGTASPWIGRLSLGQRRPVFCIAVSMLQAALLCRVSPICARSGQGKCAQPHPAPVVVSATCASASSPSRQGRRGAYEEGPVVRGAPAASPLVPGAGSADPLWYETILIASLCTLSPSSADLSRLYFGLRPSATQPSCVSGPSWVRVWASSSPVQE